MRININELINELNCLEIIQIKKIYKHGKDLN